MHVSSVQRCPNNYPLLPWSSGSSFLVLHLHGHFLTSMHMHKSSSVVMFLPPKSNYTITPAVGGRWMSLRPDYVHTPTDRRTVFWPLVLPVASTQFYTVPRKYAGNKCAYACYRSGDFNIGRSIHVRCDGEVVI